MAMAVRTTNAHWKMKEILPRHWVEIGKRYGVLDEDGQTAKSVIHGIVEQTPQVVASIESSLPKGFPESVSGPILHGLQQASEQLARTSD